MLTRCILYTHIVQTQYYVTIIGGQSLNIEGAQDLSLAHPSNSSRAQFYNTLMRKLFKQFDRTILYRKLS